MALTYLFTPAHEERKVARALASDTDAVILDLETSTPEDQKNAARRLIREAVPALRRPNGPEVWIRVNADGPELAADIAGVNWADMTGAVVARAERQEPFVWLAQAGAKHLLPLIESLAGFDALDRLGAMPGVDRFAIGTWDLMLDLRLTGVADPDDSELIWRMRGDLVVASRRFELAPPIDGVFVRLDDDLGLRAVSERALRLGYAGKLLIHPRQIAVARSVFGLLDEDVRFAREIVDAYETALASGRGAVRVRGQMVDGPVVERARALLTRLGHGAGR